MTMVKSLALTSLAPNVRTIGIAGGTGDGKSEVTSTFADPRAKKVLAKSIGETNSTLKERRVVYSEDRENEIVLAVKIKDTIFEREDFNNLISVSVSKIIRDYGKSMTIDFQKLRVDFISNLRNEIQTKVNSRAVLTFLNKENIKFLVEEIDDIFNSIQFFEKFTYQIYNGVKNDLKSQEVKNNSTKFFSAIKGEVEKSIDHIDKERMWLLLNDINTWLQNVFFQYFSEDNQSIDDYYFHVIDLDNQENSADLISAMFTSNNLRKGETLSIEVFCSDIVIYAPMHPKILEMIKRDDTSNKVFMGKDGKVSIALYDTKGLYHEDASDDANLDYFTELLYSINYDALMLVCPLSGDTNESRLRELYTKALQNYHKQVPIFILNNKVDLFINELNKELNSDDPLSFEVSDKKLEFTEVKRKVSERLRAIRDELQKVQHTNRKNAEILSLPCYLKKDSSMSKELLVEYNATTAIQTIIKEMAKHLDASSEKIPFYLSDIDHSDMLPIIHEDKIQIILEQLLQQKETERKILAPAALDVSNNIRKVPHGNSYNALKRRLKFGKGYTSNIDENYYYNCHPFSVNFPGNLKNIITSELIVTCIDEAVEYKGGYFKDQEGSERLKAMIIEQGYFNSIDFVAEMLYYNALENAEKQAFSYGARFEKFIDHCMTYFNSHNLNISAYRDAMIKTLHAVVKRAIDLHILYV